jgi:protein tyrosine phosphatase (PTP) superfamily phosphohydrolase (DUF442 family)
MRRTPLRTSTAAVPGTRLRAVVLGAVAVIALGNLAILTAFGLARVIMPAPERQIAGVDHLRVLNAAGVDTVIDLRAERDLVVDEALLDELGIHRLHIPIRDGQVPDDRTLRAALDAMRDAEGRVYIHCGAGVGRTGTVAGAWLVNVAHIPASAALVRNLAVGPPSLEQIVFVAGLDRSGEFDQPGPVITGLSRLWDAPRRIFSYR